MAAYRTALMGKGHTSPNPPVGAVLVRDHTILFSGYHPRAGFPHAERYVLKKAGSLADNATLYVTLEPCCFHGRTPPCTSIIIQSRIRKVVIGTLDSHPEVRGKGIEILKNHGIQVDIGVCEGPVKELIKEHATFWQKKKPYVRAKIALTLDGCVGRPDSRLYITSQYGLGWVHHLRALSDAVLIGSGTARIDNPWLTIRLPLEYTKPYMRCVLDTHLKTDSASPLFRGDVRTVVFHAESHTPSPERLNDTVEYVPVPSVNNRLDLTRVFEWLAHEEVRSLLIEPGPSLFRTLLEEGHLDELWFIQSHSMARTPERVSLIHIHSMSPEKAGLVLVDVFTSGYETLYIFRRKEFVEESLPSLIPDS